MALLLFIDHGTIVLHVDPRGSVFLSDSITRKLRQQLDYDGPLDHSSGVYREDPCEGVLHVVCLCLPLNFALV